MRLDLLKRHAKKTRIDDTLTDRKTIENAGLTRNSLKVYRICAPIKPIDLFILSYTYSMIAICTLKHIPEITSQHLYFL